MNKEEIEKAKEDLSFMNEGDYITPEIEHSARVLEEYIKKLENEIEMYKDFKEIANMKMGDRNVIRAIKNYKTLDKVTDKLKERIKELDNLKENYIKLKEYDQVDFTLCKKREVQNILNIIEGGKKE